MIIDDNIRSPHMLCLNREFLSNFKDSLDILSKKFENSIKLEINKEDFESNDMV